MKDVSLEAAPTTKSGADAELIGRARAVLEANWLGHGTSPSLQLYPHQWSWDAACIAMGYASWNQSRAEQELRSLFAGQWRNGLLPHIVFTEGASYFPGPDFWETERSADAPERPRTSGIVQPPIHATAAWQVYLHGADRRQATAFLEELFPRLRSWHEYLYRERCRNGDGLVEIWHPWESGMDNSPLWDEALERMSPDSASIPEYERVDVEVADAAERPSDAEYDRYVYLVGLFRDLAYEPSRIRDAVPFALQPVLFNSLLVRSNQDLARIARALGSDADPFEAWAESTAAGLESLWDDERALYVDNDVIAGKRVGIATAAGLAPLYAGVPDPKPGGAHGRTTRGLPRARRGLGVGRDEPLARRSGLPADALLARAGVADPELGAPARPGALRVPGARRAGEARRRRPRPERGVLGALRPAHRQGARRGAVRLDGRPRPRPPPGRRDGEKWGRANIDFDRISCYTRMTNRVERGIRRTDRRNVARVHPRSAGSKVMSSACGCPSGSARCISAQEGPL